MKKDELMAEVEPYGGNDEVVVAIDVDGTMKYYTVKSVDSTFASEDVCTLCVGKVALM